MADANRRSSIRRMAARPLPLLLGLVALSLAACGGGGGTRPSPTPAPPPAPAPTPTPTPAPTPTPTPPPTGSFDTAETRRSDGVNFHGAITAYQAGATGQNILAGVIDDGIDQNSPEFAGRISSQSIDLAGSRGINGEGTHGTNVAQLLLGGKNDVGTFGIAFNANLLVLRADRPGSCATEDPSNDESGCRFPETAIAAGLDRAVGAGARVVNISLGGEDLPGATLRAAVSRATAAGISSSSRRGMTATRPRTATTPTPPMSSRAGCATPAAGSSSLPDRSTQMARFRGSATARAPMPAPTLVRSARACAAPMKMACSRPRVTSSSF